MWSLTGAGQLQTPSVSLYWKLRGKIPCRTGESNPNQHYVWLFCPNALPTELSRPWNAWVPMECKGLHLDIFWQNRQGKIQIGLYLSAQHRTQGMKLGNSVSSAIPTCLAALPWASHLLYLILDGTLLVCWNFASHSWWNKIADTAVHLNAAILVVILWPVVLDIIYIYILPNPPLIPCP